MLDTTITFRTDEKLKTQATELFESLGMSLSAAINMFLRQAVAKQMYPCSLDLEISKDASSTYPDYFFELFGSGKDLDLDNEPTDAPFSNDAQRLDL